MPTYRVVGEWLIEADDAHQAENLIENAVASQTSADLDNCDATPADDDDQEPCPRCGSTSPCGCYGKFPAFDQ